MEGYGRSFLYNVEILIEEETHQQALIKLLKELNSLSFVDYKINSGIQLGSEIQNRKQKATHQQSVPISSDSSKTVAKREAKKSNSTTYTTAGLEQFEFYRDKNKLIRLVVNRGLGVKLSIPCRVLNIDEQQLLISVYHVDEKQVYTFRLIEIEDVLET